MSRSPDQQPFDGMTVNERLFATGLMDKFDEAVRAGDLAQMTAFLSRVGLESQAAKIAEAVLVHPTRYGRIELKPGT